MKALLVHVMDKEIFHPEEKIKCLQLVAGHGDSQQAAPFKVGMHFIVCNENGKLSMGFVFKDIISIAELKTIRPLPKKLRSLVGRDTKLSSEDTSVELTEEEEEGGGDDTSNSKEEEEAQVMTPWLNFWRKKRKRPHLLKTARPSTSSIWMLTSTKPTLIWMMTSAVPSRMDAKTK
jgi:hypothetical protein